MQVDIRDWENEKPTKKGVSLTLVQFKNLMAVMELSVSLVFTQDHTEPERTTHFTWVPMSF
jgi:hypothetical protein